jgi:hypothetical protein
VKTTQPAKLISAWMKTCVTDQDVMSKKTAPLALTATDLESGEDVIENGAVNGPPVTEAHLALKATALRTITPWNSALPKESSAIS